MGVCILRRIQGLRKCSLLLIFLLFCLLLRYHPTKVFVQQAYNYAGAAAYDHHIYETAQGYTSAQTFIFPSECLSSTMQATQQEKRVLIYREGQEKADMRGDNMEEEMKKARTLRKRIGSRPPMCRDKCETCFPCEAVKMVPTPTFSSPSAQNFAHLDYTNYDPEGWKCKCGARIFNP